MVENALEGRILFSEVLRNEPQFVFAAAAGQFMKRVLSSQMSSVEGNQCFTALVKDFHWSAMA
ncbi:MAG: hypothetical protein CFE29_03925 [Bradyrhizobiaceae bacterium PARB1]|nr:MAG: hypothetical protein CFE29_03925 [Bradyrhizobiaceae bacterium PARB1]